MKQLRISQKGPTFSGPLGHDLTPTSASGEFTAYPERLASPTINSYLRGNEIGDSKVNSDSTPAKGRRRRQRRRAESKISRGRYDVKGALLGAFPSHLPS
jgi:hypothetical protein